MIAINKVNTQEQIDQFRELVTEYVQSWFENHNDVPQVQVDLAMNQIKDFKKYFAGSNGASFLATSQDKPIGCIGLLLHSKDVCEIKRLYVRKEYRGNRIGRNLTKTAISYARGLGYKTVLIHTVKVLKEAIQLYYSLNFKPTEPYDETLNEPDAVFMKLILS